MVKTIENTNGVVRFAFKEAKKHLEANKEAFGNDGIHLALGVIPLAQYLLSVPAFSKVHGG